MAGKDFLATDKSGKSYKGKEAISVRKEQMKEISGTLTNEKIIKEIEKLQELHNDPNNLITNSDGEKDFSIEIYNEYLYNRLDLLTNINRVYANYNTSYITELFNLNLKEQKDFYEARQQRIEEELQKRNVVIVAGFQGIDENADITTLGRGGSDTTAVALQAALKADKCYIFSDVDGVYTADPNKIENAKKLPALSYEEMIEISSEGAKVLHGRCAEIGQKFKIPIITKSTFNNKAGTIITDIIEENTIKSVVKKEISRISIVGNGISRNFEKLHEVLNIIQKNKLEILEFNVSESKISIDFKNVVDDEMLEKIHKIIKREEKA